ncbi:MAG TPA: F0F1 ATP synthase subunit delta [Candidatus Binatia bacterium]|nr:F0F1 ATP synthase subunit delta [Candidatus Binatia bacterium]
MAEAATLARPYAKAIFDLAFSEKKLGEWSALLAGLAQAVRDPDVQRWIGHPAIGRGQLGDVLIETFGAGASLQARNLVKLLAEYDRLTLAPEITAQFEQLKADAERTLEVEITAAQPVDPAQQKALADAIGKRLQRDVQIDWKSNPNLIGGAVVRAGDLVIDGSVAAELNQLRTALTA